MLQVVEPKKSHKSFFFWFSGPNYLYTHIHISNGRQPQQQQQTSGVFSRAIFSEQYTNDWLRPRDLISAKRAENSESCLFEIPYALN